MDIQFFLTLPKEAQKAFLKYKVILLSKKISNEEEIGLFKANGCYFEIRRKQGTEQVFNVTQSKTGLQHFTEKELWQAGALQAHDYWLVKLLELVGSRLGAGFHKDFIPFTVRYLEDSQMIIEFNDKHILFYTHGYRQIEEDLYNIVSSAYYYNNQKQKAFLESLATDSNLSEQEKEERKHSTDHNPTLEIQESINRFKCMLIWQINEEPPH